MAEANAPVPINDQTTRKLFGNPVFRITRRGGYDPGDVAEFLNRFGPRVVALLERLRKAESENEVLTTEVGHWRERAHAAEHEQGTFQRAISLAEKTAIAAVADARNRAVEITTEARHKAEAITDEARHQGERVLERAQSDAQTAYAGERQKLVDEWQRVKDYAAQLETYRLSVAAETLALEEARNDLRRRIRMAAAEMLAVAERPDGLGQPVSHGLPEHEGEDVQLEAARPGLNEPSPDDRPVPTSEEAVTIAQSAPMLAPSPESAPADAGDDASADDAAREYAAIEVESTVAENAEFDDDPESDEKFAQFMSDEIEDEPSREWILTG